MDFQPCPQMKRKTAHTELHRWNADRVTGWVCEKIGPNCHPIRVLPKLTRSLNFGKEWKNVGIFSNFKETVQIKQWPKWRKITQSGHTDAADNLLLVKKVWDCVNRKGFFFLQVEAKFRCCELSWVCLHEGILHRFIHLHWYTYRGLATLALAAWRSGHRIHLRNRRPEFESRHGRRF
jgi:hypothetical protein